MTGLDQRMKGLKRVVDEFPDAGREKKQVQQTE
jgi:hypothetical protein